MRRVTFAALAVMLFLIASAYGCDWTKSIHANDDNVSDTIIARTGTFTTCGTEIQWHDSFHRTSSQACTFSLRIKYVGSPVYNQYPSNQYGLGDYSNSGTNCTEHTAEIIIGKSDWMGRGLFTNITAQASFYNSCTPSRPQGH